MKGIREDAWSADDDVILAETVLRHIRVGSTQLSAFEEAGRHLTRTAAACGFRWNATVRKRYEAAIQIAKQQRKELKNQNRQAHKRQLADRVKITGAGPESIGFDDVIRFVRQTHQKSKELHLTERDYAQLRQENETLKKRVEVIEKEYKQMSEVYKSLLRIMDKARKLAFLQEGELDSPLRMDSNDALDKIG